MNSQFFWKAGSALAVTGVALGAFGAHGLSKVVGGDATKIKNWEVASNYQLLHSIALIVLSAVPKSVKRIHPAALPLLFTGTLLFSGTIYLLTLKRDQFRFLGPITPLGGLALMAGWAALLF